MATTTFHIVEYIKALQANGCSSQQAQIHGEYLEKLYHDHLFTKEDGERLKNEINYKLNAIKNDILIKMGGMITLAVGILTLIRFFGK